MSKVTKEQQCTELNAFNSVDVTALCKVYVVGPRQESNSQFSALMPMFLLHAVDGVLLVADGDGTESRDCKCIDNVLASVGQRVPFAWAAHL